MIKRLKSTIEFNLKYNSILRSKIEEIDRFYNKKNTDQLVNEQFVKIVKIAEKNSFYQKYYSEHQIDFKSIQDPSDLKNLPQLTRSMVKENGHLLKRKLFMSKGYTSGTTGTPLIVYRDFNSIIKENAYVWWYRMQCGLKPKDKKVSIRGNLGKDQLYFFDRASNTLHFSSFSLNKENFEIIWKKILRFQPKAILGYPSSLSVLANLFSEANKKCNIPLCFTSSEELFSHQEIIIQKIFNTCVYDWYGNSERTIALYRDNNKYYEPLLYSVNLYKSEYVLTTSLINNAFPLINYRVEDIIKKSKNYDYIKKSYVIDKINGRKEEYIVLKDGSKVGSAALSLIFKDVDLIVSQIIQLSSQELIFNIVPGPSFCNIENFKKKIIAKLGTKIDFKVNIVSNNEIVYNSSGKYKLIIKKV